MNHGSNRFALLLLMLVTPFSLIAQWTQSNGPFGGSIRSLAVSGPDLAGYTLWASTKFGIYVSPDGGANWKATSMFWGNIGDEAHHSSFSVFRNNTGGNSIYCSFLSYWGGGFGAGCVLSTDEGSNWQFASGHVPIFAKLYPNGSSHFYAVDSALFRSTDDGLTWTRLSYCCYAFNSFTTSGSFTYAASSVGVMRSTDEWVTWENVSDGLPSWGIQCLGKEEFPDGRASLFVGTESGVFRRGYGAQTWGRLNDGLGTQIVNTFVDNGAEMFAQTDLGVYRLADSTRWVNTNLIQTRGRTLVVAPPSSGGSDLFAGTEHTGVFKSTNNGITWRQMNTGIGLCVTDVAEIGTSMFVVVPGEGVFRSANNGRWWVSAGLTNLNVVSIVAKGNNLIAGTKDPGIFVSTDLGSTWKQENGGWIGNEGISLASDGNYLFAATSSGVFRSTDSAKTWIPVKTWGTGWPVYLPDWRGRKNILAVNDGEVLVASDSGIFRSPDMGETWFSANGDLPHDYNLPPLVVLSVAIHRGFAGTRELLATTSTGIYGSIDEGMHWTLLHSGFFNCVEFSGETIFVGGAKGITWSDANRQSWKDWNTGFDGWSVSWLHASGSTIFAGSPNGVWKRPLEDLTNTAEAQPKGIPSEFHLSQNYPNPFNPTTTITYQLPATVDVRLAIYDLLGREVAVLVNERRNAGVHEVNFDGSRLASGVYFYRLSVSLLARRDLVTRERGRQAGTYVQTRKLLLVR